MWEGFGEETNECRLLQRLILGVLNVNLKDWSMREVVVMINMIGVLANQLDGDSTEVMGSEKNNR